MDIMREEEDILFQIAMQLYDEFNDKFCEMNEHLGDFYGYKDIEDLEKYQKEKEIELLRKAVGKQQKELQIKDKIIDEMKYYLDFGKFDFNCGMCVHDDCQVECMYEHIINKVQENENEYSNKL